MEYSGKDLCSLDSHSLHCFMGKNTLSWNSEIFFLPKWLSSGFDWWHSHFWFIRIPSWCPDTTPNLHNWMSTGGPGHLYLSQTPEAILMHRHSWWFGAVLEYLIAAPSKSVEDDAKGHGDKEPALSWELGFLTSWGSVSGWILSQNSCDETGPTCEKSGWS